RAGLSPGPCGTTLRRATAMDEIPDVYVEHHHAPPHLFRAGAAYIITARTLDRCPTLAKSERRQQIIDSLHYAAMQRDWKMIAWVTLPNHYHCILKAPDDDPSRLATLIRAAHRYTSLGWNREDRRPGRQVWYQFWDTCLT